MPPIYSLDSTDVAKWEEKVLGPAVSIIDDKISGRSPSRESLNSNKTENIVHSDSSIAESHYCEVIINEKKKTKTEKFSVSNLT